MNKTELSDAVAAAGGFTKTDGKKVVDSFFSIIAGALKKGDKVALIGFGTFETKKRPARKGRNPQTGKELKIAAKKVVRFKAGKALTASVK